MKTLITWLSAAFTVLASAAPENALVSREALEPFLGKYCVECHGPDEQEGQVRFDQLDWEIADNNTAQRWQDVLDQLNGGDMPPFEADEFPSDSELAAVLDSLTGSVVTARKRLTDHGGEIKMRRLNRREYAATIRDLFGFDVPLHQVPDDGEIESFDTVGEEQFFTSAHFDQYLELGRKVATTALEYNTRPHAPVETKRLDPEKQVNRKMRESLAEKDRQKALLEAGKSWQEAGFKDEGEVQILLSQWDSRAEMPRLYLQYPFVETGVYNTNRTKFSSISQRVDIRADYFVRVHGGVVESPPEIRKLIRLVGRDRLLGTLKMLGTPEDPQSVSLSVRQPMGATMLAVKVLENVPNSAQNSRRGYINQVGHPREYPDPRPSVWFDWLEIEGPFYPEKQPRFEALLYPDGKTGGRSPYWKRDRKARELIARFTKLAFRQKAPDSAYLEALYGNFDQLREAGESYEEALAEVMAIVLASPSFLFIQEAVPAQESPHGQLANRELAIRLSYFLWSSPPDDELFAADLSDPATYAQQVDRLLADPRAHAFRDGFVSQWAELDRYDAITVDDKEHYQFNEGVEQDAKREVVEFFGALLEENLPARHLIDSDFAVVNGALANHYDLPFNNTGDDSFQKVPLPADSHRGGFLTQAAFLVTGSNGERSSPVIRGALIMEKILHDKPAPPPPNVPELDEASDKPMTNRRMVIQHQNRATCASCHQKMDIIGFGLENFDPIGRWRDDEKVGRKRVPIEPGGVLPNRGEFANVSELKQLLLQHDGDLAEELTESVLAYALGRTVEFSDTDDVERILARLEKGDYRLRDLVREVALSPVFRRK